MSSFVNRQLRASLILPQGVFPGTNSNTLVLSGLRIEARLEGVGNLTNSCEIHIYGMRQVDMNAVTVTFGQAGNVQGVNPRAVLRLEVSTDNPGSWLQIFSGQFFEAMPDYRATPEVCLTAMAMTGYAAQIISVSPVSVNGPANVADLAQQLATGMGFSFENNGVTGVLNSPYLEGTALDQFRSLKEAAGFDYYFDAQGTLAICPANQPRLGRTAVVLNAKSGLVGYPTLNRFGCTVKCLFNPAIALGAPIKLSDTQVPGCDGIWFPRLMRHELDSIKPSGQWFSTLEFIASSAYEQPTS
jgi:hypothetical protein